MLIEVGDFYKYIALGKAVRVACDKARVPKWTPFQLRYLAAHPIREALGIDAVAASLGHSRINMSEHYSSKELSLEIEVAKKLS